jgi:hypothetical protein
MMSCLSNAKKCHKNFIRIWKLHFDILNIAHLLGQTANLGLAESLQAVTSEAGKCWEREFRLNGNALLSSVQVSFMKHHNPFVSYFSLEFNVIWIILSSRWFYINDPVTRSSTFTRLLIKANNIAIMQKPTLKNYSIIKAILPPLLIHSSKAN